MANWCNNTIIVKGNEDKVKEFDEAFKGKRAYWGIPTLELYGKNGKDKTEEELEQLNEKYYKEYLEEEPEYKMNALYPVPQEILDIGYSVPTKSGSSDLSIREEMKMIKDGYSWCDNMWGTKWDIDVEYVNKDDKEESIYAFGSAWSPPLEWLNKVSSDFPDLIFEIRYHEDGCAFGGIIVFQGGDAIEVNQSEPGGENYRKFMKEFFEYDPYQDCDIDEE